MDSVKKHWQLILIGILSIILAVSLVTRPSPNVQEYILKQKVDSLELVIKTFPELRAEIERQHKLDMKNGS